MRRIAAAVPALAAVLSLAACGAQPSSTPAPAPAVQANSPSWQVDLDGRASCATTRLPAHGQALLEARLDGDRATLTGTVHGSRWLRSLDHPRLTLTSAGGTVTAALHAVRYGPGGRPAYLPGSVGHGAGRSSILCLARFGAGPPTAVTAAYAGGAHCCTRLHLLDPAGNSFALETGNVGASLRLVDGDLVLQTGDDAFNYAFADFADSCAPVTLMLPSGGRFRDVTREHPQVLRADARRAWRFAQQRDIRLGFLSCWAADQDRLGADAKVWPTLAHLDEQGLLTLPPELRDMWKDGAAYLSHLRAFLTERGYRAS